MIKIQRGLRVRGLKQRIQERTTIPSEVQRLLFHGRPLDDHCTCEKIVNEGRVELALGALGGVESPASIGQSLPRPALPVPPPLPDPWCEGGSDPWFKGVKERSQRAMEERGGSLGQAGC